MYQVGGKEFDDWTLAQDQAVQLLEDGVEYVNILQWDDERKTWGLLQELNLEVCGKCGNSEVVFSCRTVDKFTYHELRCTKCNYTLSLGHGESGLFPDVMNQMRMTLRFPNS